ncbi:MULTISPECIES: amidohydrolase [Pseudoalteromonas]|uniref:amidohydrolase family protein n=1 Tax=Pseudoalteromonas TaxID=53246 RepID=UPI00078643B1|nr:amidohydrolase family protein [Pseudoalteromonas arabiensis]|tara:strand:- start:3916 stop:4758 length:843 start_codon:yes stop_codon:yes gene_type:complete
MSDKIIDPHIHFFNLNEGQYIWLQGEHPPAWPNLTQIKAPVSVEQLQSACSFELEALVHIEAGFDNQAPIKELNWLATHLKDFAYKAISYSQIDAPNSQFINAMTELRQPTLVGIRDITEGDDATRLCAPNSLENLAYLAAENLLFETQFEIENHAVTEQLITYCHALPSLRVVINHLGFIKNPEHWLKAITKLSRCNNIAIKFSGLEFSSLSKDTHRWLLKNLLNHFGEQRIMFASNFPVCQIEVDYSSCWLHYFSLCDTHHIWQQLSNKNSRYIYQIS